MTATDYAAHTIRLHGSRATYIALGIDMANADIFSDSFVVAWDEALNSLVIVHPDAAIPRPVVQIRAATLSEMSFEQASSFLGERLILLINALRERYVDPATGRVVGAPDA